MCVSNLAAMFNFEAGLLLHDDALRRIVRGTTMGLNDATILSHDLRVRRKPGTGQPFRNEMQNYDHA